MALAHSPRIITTGLRHCFDFSNPKSYVSGTTVTDMVTKGFGTNGILNEHVSWMNDGVSQITFFVCMTRLTTNTAYAVNPFSKYGGTTNNTFNMYMFGNNNNTSPASDGIIRMYSNRGGVWGSVGDPYTVSVGQTVLATWQINSTDGGQLWVNGAKIGSRSGSGIFGSTNNTSNLIVDTPLFSSVIKLNHISIYDRELSDSEIKQYYNNIRGRFGI